MKIYLLFSCTEILMNIRPVLSIGTYFAACLLAFFTFFLAPLILPLHISLPNMWSQRASVFPSCFCFFFHGNLFFKVVIQHYFLYGSCIDYYLVFSV